MINKTVQKLRKENEELQSKINRYGKDLGAKMQENEKLCTLLDKGIIEKKELEIKLKALEEEVSRLQNKYESCCIRTPKYMITIKENPNALGGVEINQKGITLHDSVTVLEVAKSVTEKIIRNI